MFWCLKNIIIIRLAAFIAALLRLISHIWVLFIQSRCKAGTLLGFPVNGRIKSNTLQLIFVIINYF
jgi:hypothetical protein